MITKEKFLFILWFLLVSIPLSILMAQHNLAFKTHEKSFYLDGIKVRAETRFVFLHVLGANCGCSKKVSQYLESRVLSSHVQEKILIVEGSLENESELVKKGIEIERLTPEELKTKYGIESAPQLFVLNSDGRSLYAGGYKKNEDTQFKDIEILASIEKGERPISYPVFGCAFGKKLKDQMDPLKFKYTVKD